MSKKSNESAACLRTNSNGMQWTFLSSMVIRSALQQMLAKRIAIYAAAWMPTYRSCVELFRFVGGGRASDGDGSPLRIQ